jgi:hypothetical protein
LALHFRLIKVARKKAATKHMIRLLLNRLLGRNKKTAAMLAERKQPTLGACIVMDLLGYATFALPFVGEVFDVIWAPMSAMIFMRMFGGAKGVFGGIFNFIEELLPGLDFIPTFTIAWMLQNFRKPKTANTIIIANSR